MLDAPALATRTDRELLDSFAGRRDEAAFAALVRRRSPATRPALMRLSTSP
jgi:hypothetical protein